METELTTLLIAVAKGQKQPNGKPTAINELMTNAAKEIAKLNSDIIKMKLSLEFYTDGAEAITRTQKSDKRNNND